MALLETGRAPTPAELRYFGVVLGIFGFVLAGVVYTVSGSAVAAHCIWSAGVLLASVYYFLPPLRYLFYVTWMAAFYPIGWTISHLLMGLIYYAVLTPIGLVMRSFGRDVLSGKRPRDAETYWKPVEPSEAPSRYFQQF